MFFYEEEGEGKRRKDCASFLELARVQMRRAFVPAAVAVLVSVLINNLGAPFLALCLLGGVWWAWYRGWRIKLIKTK